VTPTPGPRFVFAIQSDPATPESETPLDSVEAISLVMHAS